MLNRWNFLKTGFYEGIKVEVEAAVASVKSDPRMTGTSRFVSVMLNEPAKETVLDYIPGSSVEREALVILLDNASGHWVLKRWSR